MLVRCAQVARKNFGVQMPELCLFSSHSKSSSRYTRSTIGHPEMLSDWALFCSFFLICLSIYGPCVRLMKTRQPTKCFPPFALTTNWRLVVSSLAARLVLVPTRQRRILHHAILTDARLSVLVEFSTARTAPLFQSALTSRVGRKEEPPLYPLSFSMSRVKCLTPLNFLLER